ncbi:MAG: hypothetical protein EP348_11945 [Alphaproteobacteria bacterium]|nr:MAG: hypothetical protein EP348_11945 [Alphaproteobacteria bacterium]
MLVLTVVNHPEIIENHFEEFAALRLSSPQLDRLRRAIIDIAAVESSLDYASMGHHLAKRKLSGQVRELQSAARSLDWFAGTDAAFEDARSGWLHVLARHKREALEKEVKTAERDLGENATAENLDRLKIAKQALQNAAGNEAELDGFGLASGRKSNI